MNAYECTALSKALPHTDQDAQEGEFTLAVESMPAVISPPAPSLAAGWKNRLPSELFFEVYALCLRGVLLRSRRHGSNSNCKNSDM